LGHAAPNSLAAGHQPASRGFDPAATPRSEAANRCAEPLHQQRRVLPTELSHPHSERHQRREHLHALHLPQHQREQLMGQNPFTFIGQAITQLLSSNSATLQATGLDIFRGLAVILIVWFGVKAALSASQGGGGFHFAKFADLILMIAFGLGMLTYYSTPIPGTSYSFSDLITKEGLNLSNQIESDQTQQITDTINNAENQLGAPPGSFNI